MSRYQIRRFARSDRDQVTSLVNAHIAAVVPAVAVSVSGLMSQLEREPGDFIVDPWVTERVTLVAEQRERVVAAAHLLRYADDARVSAYYRHAGEIRWLVYWPSGPHGADTKEAANALADACLAQLQRWGVTRCHADGALPAPGVYGVPEQWPHIRDLYRNAGFHDAESWTETIFLARVSEIPRSSPELADATRKRLVPHRTVGINGTRISVVLNDAILDDAGPDDAGLNDAGISNTLAQQVIGYIEVGSLDESPRTMRTQGWADIGNLEVSPGYSRAAIGGWLLAQAADWLELGGVSRLLGYTGPDDEAEAEFLATNGFRILTRTVRGLTRTPPD
jgi:GNAT superfamily N-acetyltransferase